MSEAIVIALVTAALGGGAVAEAIRRLRPPAEKVIEDKAAFRREQDEAEVQFRNELRGELDRLYKRVARLEDENDRWRTSYAALQGTNAALERRVALLEAELQRLGLPVPEPPQLGRRAYDLLVKPPPEPGT